jgi:hypothetical protein
LIHHRDKVHPSPPYLMLCLRTHARLHHTINGGEGAEGSPQVARHV